MRNFITTTACVLFSVLSVNAQSEQQAGKKKSEPAPSPEMKSHTCSASCKDGAHMYAHGETGHLCSPQCHQMQGSQGAELKKHKCNASCHEGKHAFVHGEKGHACDKTCKKGM
jgi:hypothetical protein